MRKLYSMLPAALAVLALCLLSSTTRAGISGSKHDFGTFGWSGNQICQPCHAPHGTAAKDAAGNVLGGPLWNHTLSSATYTLYYTQTGVDVNGNAILTSTTGNQTSLDSNSVLCLSCHDGTVALDSFGGATGTTTIGAGYAGSNSKANLGTDLSVDHPIGSQAIYPTSGTFMVAASLHTSSNMPLRALPSGQLAVGCTSCHEPHNRKNQSHLLWVNNSGTGTTLDGRTVSGSLLCMNCHVK